MSDLPFGSSMRYWSFILCLVSLTGLGQQDQLQHHAQLIMTWQKAKPTTKLHLFFHQPQYAPGDTAFFRAALVWAAELLPGKGSQIAALDVVNSAGEVLIHQEFRIRDGWSGNQLIIPADFKPGIYRVVAYTYWMRNFDTPVFFHGELYVTGRYQFLKEESSEPITLFPEGGTLVEGVRNRVVVKGIASVKKGSVLNSQQQPVTEFTLNDNGYGFFFITPATDERYTVQTGDQNVLLGPAEPDGVSVLVIPASVKGPLHRFVLQTPLSSPLRNEELYVIISGHGNVFFSTTIRFGQQEFIAFTVPTNLLPEGIVRAAIIRNDGREIASRLLFTRNETFRPRIDLTDTVVGTRSKVSFRLALHDDSGAALQARLSVSVFNQSLFDRPFTEPDIVRYMLVNSDAQGISAASEIQTTSLDMELVTSSWPWYSGKDVQYDPNPRYYPRNYISLQGRLLNPENDKPMAESLLLTLYLQGAADIYEVETSAKGEFVAAPLFDFPDREELLYIAEKAGKRIPVKLELTQDTVRYQQSLAGVETDKESTYYRHSQLKEQVKKSFSYYGKNPMESGNTKTTRNAAVEEMLIDVDLTFNLSDYVLFPTMQETLHEIIPYLQYRKIRSSDVVRMYLPDVEKTGDGPPIFIIDGIMTLDHHYFLNLKPSSVETIKLVYSQHKRTKLGALGRNGIVLIETKISENERYVPRGSSIPLQGLITSLPFRTGKWRWEEENIASPRLRPVLYWNPLLHVDESGTITVDVDTGDDVGEYVIIIEGLTYDGIPFRTEKKFSVRYQPNLK